MSLEGIIRNFLAGNKPVPAVNKTGFTYSGLLDPRAPEQFTPNKLNFENSSLPTITPTPSPINNNFTGEIPGFSRMKLKNQDIHNMIVESAKEHNIDPALVAGVLFQESGIKPNIEDRTGTLESGQRYRDRGIAQINDIANPDITDEQARDPRFAIDFVARQLAGNLEHFGGDYNRALAAYNVGRGGAKSVGPTPSSLGPRGQDYLDRVSQNLSPELRKKYKIVTSY